MPRNSFYLAALLLAAAALPALSAEEVKNAAAKPHPVLAASDDFAFRLYGRLAREDGNVFFSPYSITVAMAMTMEGARGATAAEMEKTLGLPPDAGARRKFFAQDTKFLGDALGVEMANAFWAHRAHKFLSGYTRALKKYYRAEAFGADFSAPEKARLEINSWTSDRTHGKVPDLFQKDSLTELTRLVLVDAVYFKGSWASAFDKALTAKADFFPASGTSVQADMMTLTGGRFNYLEADGLQVLELPYRNDRMSMLLVLPAQGGLKALEAELSAGRVSAWRRDLSMEPVDIFLPRFTLNARYDLRSVLSEMGMPSAFTMEADFSGMDGKRDLYIQQAVHQGFVEVNEEGTEAAAATGVSMGLKSMPAPPAEFRADRPFLFLIQERKTGRVVFMGRVQKP